MSPFDPEADMNSLAVIFSSFWTERLRHLSRDIIVLVVRPLSIGTSRTMVPIAPDCPRINLHVLFARAVHLAGLIERISAPCVLIRMDRHDNYRAKAEEAKKQADRAHSEVDRAAWLRIVQG
jgi:hypothetical protein